MAALAFTGILTSSILKTNDFFISKNNKVIAGASPRINKETDSVLGVTSDNIPITILDRIKQSFKNIDENNADSSKVNTVISELKDLLNKYDISDDVIEKISSNLKIISNENIKLIQYMQSPEIYGNSARIHGLFFIVIKKLV